MGWMSFALKSEPYLLPPTPLPSSLNLLNSELPAPQSRRLNPHHRLRRPHQDLRGTQLLPEKAAGATFCRNTDPGPVTTSSSTSTRGTARPSATCTTITPSWPTVPATSALSTGLDPWPSWRPPESIRPRPRGR